MLDQSCGGLPFSTHSVNNGDTAMRFMILVPADKHSEAGAMPDEQLLAAMDTR